MKAHVHELNLNLPQHDRGLLIECEKALIQPRMFEVTQPRSLRMAGLQGAGPWVLADLLRNWGRQ